MHDSSQCRFCKLANGLIPAFVVHENEHVTCFLSREPISEGHTLIVPKRPYLDPDELDVQTAEQIMKASILVSKALKKIAQLPIVKAAPVMIRVENFE